MSKKASAESLEYDGPAIVVDTSVPEPEPESKPDPKPGDADFDWTALYDTDDLYTHTFPNGKVVAIKSFGRIYSKTWLYKLRNAASNAEVEFAAIDRAACDEARAVLESLDDADGDPLDDLFKAWTKAGTSRGDGDEGLTPGN
jgi:hypothetical protein